MIESGSNYSSSDDEASIESSPPEEQLEPKTYRIRVHATNLPRTGPMRLHLPSTLCVVARRKDEFGDPSKHDTLLQTEVIQRSSDPQWTTTADLCYKHDGKPDYLKVAVVQTNENGVHKKPLGMAIFELGDVLATKHQVRVKRMSSGGCVFLRLVAIETKNCQKWVRLQARGLGLVPPHRKRRMRLRPDQHYFAHEPHTVLELAKKSSLNHTSWVTVYRSQTVRSSSNPVWEAVTLDYHALCNGDPNWPLRWYVRQVQSNNQRRVIGLCETTLHHILTGVQQGRASSESLNNDDDETLDCLHDFTLQRSEFKTTTVGRLGVVRAQVFQDDDTLEQQSLPRDASTLPAPDFQDCLLDVCVAIDFTSSNGDPRQATSYHYQSTLNNEDSLNDYEETLTALDQGLQGFYEGAYRGELEYTVWGFGVKFDQVVRQLFQCGPTATCKGLTGLLDAYRSVFLSDITMSGPSVVTQVLQAAAVRAKRHSENPATARYTVLVILTDGTVDDLAETQRKLNVYSNLPLSVIVVGVGRSSFVDLHRLTGPTVVEFRNLQHDPAALGRAALAQLPGQIRAYYASCQTS